MPSLSLPTIDPSTLDDLIYFSRTGDLPSLTETITSLSTARSTTPLQILLSALDPSTQNTLLHYPSANGSIEVLEYLLSLLSSPSPSPSQPSQEPLFVNTQNSAGNTPLHWAALNGHLACVKALVGKGADPGVLNGAGKDTVFEAENGGKEGGRAVVEWLEREGKNLEKGIRRGGEGGEGEEVSLGDGEEERGGGRNGAPTLDKPDGDGDKVVK